jgi:YbgC/YbaW family acyl-CoA thioester hydrolase
MTAKPFVIDEYVRWSEVDAAGIIFYGSYVRFFELAETELFRSVGLPYSIVFDKYDLYLPRVQVHSEFHYPARLDDHLRVAAYFGRIGTKSITLNVDVIHLGRHCLAADGHLVLVATDRKALKSKPLPPELVATLAPYTMSKRAARAYLQVSGPGQ